MENESLAEAPTESQIIQFDSEVDDSEADRLEIKRLHDSILYHARFSLDEGICIGEILVRRKVRCGHGKFESWLESNVEFAERTARRYMDLFLYRELLKSANVADLTTAGKVITSAELAERIAKAEAAKGLRRRESLSKANRYRSGIVGDPVLVLDATRNHIVRSAHRAENCRKQTARANGVAFFAAMRVAAYFNTAPATRASAAHCGDNAANFQVHPVPHPRRELPAPWSLVLGDCHGPDCCCFTAALAARVSAAGSGITEL